MLGQKIYTLINKVCILVMAMRTGERAAGHTNQQERAHLHLSAAQTSSKVMRAKRFPALEILLSDFQGLSELYLPLPQKLTDRSNPSAIRQHLTRLKSIQLTV